MPTGFPRPSTEATTIAELAVEFGLAYRGAGDTRVTGITHDSRAVQSGDLFAALPGARAHGVAFLDQARDLGAAAVLTDDAGAGQSGGFPVLLSADPRGTLGEIAARIYGNPGDDLLVIGITGTNGKTTIAYLLEAGLRAAGYVTGVVGTTGIRIGDESLPSARTTPEAPDLHALLGLMRERGVGAVAMEVSSHALALGRVDGLHFDAAIFSNLSQDHLDFHGTMEQYFEAKADLFTSRRTACAIVCVDDEWGRRLADACDIPVTTYALDHEADVRCESITEARGQQHLSVTTPDGMREVVVGIPGRFNAANALAAWTALYRLGLPETQVVTGMSRAQVPGRMEMIDEGQDFVALVDYAHSPDAVERVISAVQPGPGGRRIVVLGCGGDRDREKRPMMGRIGAAMADVLIVTDDNPRSEPPAVIRAAMLEGARGEGGDVREIADRRAAIAAAVADARASDVVMILGKGHEPGQEIAGVMYPFSDREELVLALRGAR